MLFDWKAYPSSGNYWNAIRNAVFSTGILQRSGRHMKLAVGDVLTGLRAGQDPKALFDAVFNNSKWHLADEDRLIDGFPTIFGMVFENMPRTLAAELHQALRPHQGYLGVFSVHLEFGPHLALYRLRLPPKYRLEGTKLRAFFSMSNQDGRDPDDLEEMRRLGHDNVSFEDTGASRTVFDDYDTPSHFKRVAVFRDLLSRELAGGEDDAYQLTMLLEDLSPRLFNALGAAAERLAEAENEEEVAQAALSGRRYMEQLADALFPPTDVKRGNRALTRDKYKNRLWAFVEDQIPNDRSQVRAIGEEIDRVVEELNAGLHADRPKERVASSINDAAMLTANLFALAPDPPRNGYLAYTDNLRSFVRDLASLHDGGGRS
jgi:hypothetical protein